MSKIKLFMLFAIVSIVVSQTTIIRKGEKGLSSDFIKTIAINRGVLYAATENFITAISLEKDSNSVIELTKQVADQISCIKQAGDTILIGAGKTLFLYDTKSGRSSSIPPESSGIASTISCIEAAGDEVWMGTSGGGAVCYYRSDGSFYRVNRSSGLTSDNIKAIVLLSDSVVFGTASSGLVMHDRKNGNSTRIDRYGGLSNNSVTAMVRSFGLVFVGTYKGLSVYNPRSGIAKNIFKNTELKDGMVFSLHSDGQYLWIGGMGILAMYNVTTDSAVLLTPKDGVPEDFITAIASYKNHLYLATDGNGITVIDKKVPSVSLKEVQVRNRKGLVIGEVSAGRAPIKLQWSFYSPLAKGIILNSGLASTGKTNGVLAEWDLKHVMDGQYVLSLVATDATGNSNRTEELVYTDTFDPEITIDAIAPYVAKQDIHITGSFREKNIAKIVLYPGNVSASIDKGNSKFSGKVSLSQGKNIVRAVAFDRSGQRMEVRRQVVYSDKPLAVNIDPFPKSTKETRMSIKGVVVSATPVNAVIIEPAGGTVDFDKITGHFSLSLPLLAQGENAFILSVKNAGGQSVKQEFSVMLDNEGPILVLDPFPQYTADSIITISGQVKSSDLFEITVAPLSDPVRIDKFRNKFSFSRKLRDGRNVFIVTAVDTLKNMTQTHLLVIRDVIKPRLAPVSIPSISMNETHLINGRFDEENISSIEAQPGNIKAEIDTASFSYRLALPLVDGDNPFVITATDKAGNISTLRIQIPAKIERQENIVKQLKKEIDALRRQIDSLRRR